MQPRAPRADAQVGARQGSAGVSVQPIAGFAIDTLSAAQAAEAQVLIDTILANPERLSPDMVVILQAQRAALEERLGMP